MAAARSTFREKAGAVCWQKQLRDRYVAEGIPPVQHLNLKRSIVRPVSRRFAEQIILKYEWLGTMSTTSRHYGLFFGDHCAGVTCVGTGASMAGTTHHQQFRIERHELMTLARGACVHWAPPGSNSRLVSWTVKLLSRAGVGKLIWATSDSDAGEIGTIYQACGWTYIGTTAQCADGEYVSPAGRVYNKRNITGWARARGVTYSVMRDALIDAGWKAQRPNPKHRYVCILDKSDAALAARITFMSRPYPKRHAPEA